MDLTTIPHTLVDTPTSILTLLSALEALPKNIPTLYIDLEGTRLSRYGTISLITLYLQPQHLIYLVDIHTLQAQAFSTATSAGTTLKTILESPDVIKVFFDLRNDSDALHHHFGIKLHGTEDIQLMENAGRPERRRRFVNGLDRCISDDAPISATQRQQWRAAKEKGLKLYHPSKGGSYEVFDERPLAADVELYCVVDVLFLPLLRELYWGRLGELWRRRVGEETEKRVRLSQSVGYQPQSESKKFGPWE